jgi:hypothetical protein
MPVNSCSSNGKPGYKFGESGTCYTYTPGDASSRKSAKDKATAQERAAYASGYQGKSEKIEDVVLKFYESEMSTYEHFLEKSEKKDLPPLTPAEQYFADTLTFIALKYGRLEDGDSTGIWVGYLDPEKNKDKEIGVKCHNCYFFVSEKVCSIVKTEIHLEGICRLAAIPPGLVNTGKAMDEDEVEYFVRVEDPSKTPAPRRDRRTGSSRNEPGSAESGSSVTFSEAVITSLQNKMKNHNEKNDEASKKATLAALKAVYRRGAGAFSVSHRPGMTRGQWAMARVNAYLLLLRTGSPSNSKYTTDNDLLPKGHPRSSK